ncbi:MAG: hypothetical protein NVS9B12_12300 [Vulcanimicrobiaceae bacterium]
MAEPAILLVVALLGIAGGLYQWRYPQSVNERIVRRLQDYPLAVRRFAEFQIGASLSDSIRITKRLKFGGAFVAFIGLLFLAAYVAAVFSTLHHRVR